MHVQHTVIPVIMTAAWPAGGEFTLFPGPNLCAMRLQALSSLEPVPTSRLQPVSRRLLQWFASRGISEATVRRNGVMMEQRYSKLSGQQEDWIAFVYRQDGKASPPAEPGCCCCGVWAAPLLGGLRVWQCTLQGTCSAGLA